MIRLRSNHGVDENGNHDTSSSISIHPTLYTTKGSSPPSYKRRQRPRASTMNTIQAWFTEDRYRHRLILILTVCTSTIVFVTMFKDLRPPYLSHRNVKSSSQQNVNSNGNEALTIIDMKAYLKQTDHVLQPIDYMYFTIRINTWERLDQLQLSIQHHLSCPSVLQIQVIWCIDQSISIPEWLIQLEQQLEPIMFDNKSYPRVVIERHTINSLNERFHPLLPVPTAAVLSIDDDVIRPCIALDHTFYIWMRNPDRQVGFDARSHEVMHTDNSTGQVHHSPKPNTKQQWKYSYMSVTEKSNLYSLTLTRYSFLHRDYMMFYMNYMPSIIRDMVTKNFNCEDIAMSFYISSCTNGQVPLLANVWAVKSQIKMYVAKKISGTNNHKEIRDECVQIFSQLLLQGKYKFHTVPLHLGTSFDYGAAADNWNDMNVPSTLELSTHVQDAIETAIRWKEQQESSSTKWMEEMKRHRDDAMHLVYDAGYIEKTIPWKRRFNIESHSK
jgi:glucuronyl/N-acetylglucosaminyl transferase EXT2